MARLDFYADNRHFFSFALGDGGMTVGRDPACDVKLDDRRVSREHLRVERTAEGGYLLTSVGRNGTSINHREVSEAALRDEDWISVGPFVAVFRTSEREPPESLGDEPTVAVD